MSGRTPFRLPAVWADACLIGKCDTRVARDDPEGPPGLSARQGLASQIVEAASQSTSEAFSNIYYGRVQIACGHMRAADGDPPAERVSLAYGLDRHKNKKRTFVWIESRGVQWVRGRHLRDWDKRLEFILYFIGQSQSFPNFTQNADIAIFTQRAYIVTVEERIHGYG